MSFPCQTRVFPASRAGSRGKKKMCGLPESQTPYASRTCTQSSVGLAADELLEERAVAADLAQEHGLARVEEDDRDDTSARVQRRAASRAAAAGASARVRARGRASSARRDPRRAAAACAGGSVSTNWILSAPMSKKRRIAPRDCGTANAAATAASAIAATSGHRRRRRASDRARSCGVAGHSIGSARSSRSRSIRLLQPVERARTSAT